MNRYRFTTCDLQARKPWGNFRSNVLSPNIATILFTQPPEKYVSEIMKRGT